MMNTSHPMNSWCFAWLQSGNIKNTLPVLSRNIHSPLESISNFPPRIAHIQPFGCGVYYYYTQYQRKMEPRTRTAIYLGYRSHSIAKLLDTSTGRVFEHRFQDCEFRPDIYPRMPHSFLNTAHKELTIRKLHKLPNNANVEQRTRDYLDLLDSIRYKPLEASTIEALRRRKLHHSLFHTPSILHM